MTLQSRGLLILVSVVRFVRLESKRVSLDLRLVFLQAMFGISDLWISIPDFHKTYIHQIWQVGKSKQDDSNKTSSQEYQVINYLIFTTRVSMTTKLGWMVTYLDFLLPRKSHESLITWSYKITWQTKTIISPATIVPMTPKLGRVMTNLEDLLSIILFYPLVTWPCKITWQNKIILISPLPWCLSPSNSIAV